MNEVYKNHRKLEELSPKFVKMLVKQYRYEEKQNQKSPFKISPNLKTNIKKK